MWHRLFYCCLHFKQIIYNKKGMENLALGKTMNNRNNTNK